MLALHLAWAVLEPDLQRGQVEVQVSHTGLRGVEMGCFVLTGL